MKTIGAIAVDLRVSPLGTQSRLAEDLCGTPVLRRTVERVLRAKRLDAVHVLSPVDQGPEVARLMAGLDVVLERHAAGPPPYEQLVRASRFWGLDGWRGGVGSLCVFDEDAHVPLLASLAAQAQADAVVAIPAAAPLVDPVLIDAMIEHYGENQETTKITIVQAPPGLGAVVLGSCLLTELAPAGQPVGALLAYQPAQPAPDATGKEACYRPSSEIVQASGRLLCDTRRGFNRVRAAIEAGAEAWEAERVCRWLSAHRASHVDEVPDEIEIELTTADPYFETGPRLRPRGAMVGERGPIALDTIEQLAAAVAGWDDVRFVLAGFGEPCLHPALKDICRVLKQAGAVAVRTMGVGLSPEVEATLVETPVDVVEVMLDAATPETYRRVHGADGFDEVMQRLDRWIRDRATQHRVLPLIVPSLVKAQETYDDLEPFYETWQQRLGTAVVLGYSHCAGQMEDRAVSSLAPPHRSVCRRSFSRLLVLADGRVTTCDQDFRGRQTLGSIGETPLKDIWQGEAMQAIRTKPIAQAMELCSACDDWHRA